MFQKNYKHVKEFNGYQGQWKERLVKSGPRKLDAIPFEQSHAEVERSLQKFFSGLAVELPDVSCNPMITKEALARGYYDNKLMMDSHPFGVTTPFELYKCSNDFLNPVRRIGLKIEKRKPG